MTEGRDRIPCQERREKMEWQSIACTWLQSLLVTHSAPGYAKVLRSEDCGLGRQDQDGQLSICSSVRSSCLGPASTAGAQHYWTYRLLHGSLPPLLHSTCYFLPTCSQPSTVPRKLKLKVKSWSTASPCHATKSTEISNGLREVIGELRKKYSLLPGHSFPRIVSVWKVSIITAATSWKKSLFVEK